MLFLLFLISCPAIFPFLFLRKKKTIFDSVKSRENGEKLKVAIKEPRRAAGKQLIAVGGFKF